MAVAATRQRSWTNSRARAVPRNRLNPVVCAPLFLRWTLVSKVCYLACQSIRRMEYDREFLTGTVGVLILCLLSEREMYGYELLREAERRSSSAFQLKEGTLYPALHHMERSGLLKARWRDSEAGRSRKYYSLTATGRKRLAVEQSRWNQMSAAIASLMNPGESEGTA